MCCKNGCACFPVPENGENDADPRALQCEKQVTGLEPVISAWKANVLPLHYTCKTWERCRRAARLLSGCVLRRKNRSAGCISLPSASILRSGVHSKAGIVCRLWSGAGNGARTRHLCLGKAALYRMSYSRNMVPQSGVEPPTQGFSVPCSTS